MPLVRSALRPWPWSWPCRSRCRLRREERSRRAEARPVRIVTVEERCGGRDGVAGGHGRKPGAGRSRLPDRRAAARAAGERGRHGRAPGRPWRGSTRPMRRTACAPPRPSLAAAEAQLSEARANYDRQRQLYDRGFLARAGLERAEADAHLAPPPADAARAQFGIAKRRLNDTVLHADAPGIVTAVGAEPGEVVTAGPDDRADRPRRRARMRSSTCRPPCSRPAPPDPEITVALSPEPRRQRQGPHPRGCAPRRCRDRHVPRARRPDRPAGGAAPWLDRHRAATTSTPSAASRFRPRP